MENIYKSSRPDQVLIEELKRLMIADGHTITADTDFAFWIGEYFEYLLRDHNGITVRSTVDIPAGHVGYVAVKSDFGVYALFEQSFDGLEQLWAFGATEK